MTEDPGRDRRRDEAFAAHVDRLNVGGALDREAIRREHPDLAEELIAMLEAYEGLDAPRSVLPRSFGKFAVIREIGRGGMGVVYEALESDLERRVALKVLPAGGAIDEKALARFRREAKVAGQLRHPSIVPVYAMGVEGGTPYIAMELVEGESLEKILKKTRPEPSLDSRNWPTGPAGPASRGIAWNIASSPTAPVGAPPAGDAAVQPEQPPSSTAEVPLPAAPEAADLAYCLHMAKAFAVAAGALHHAHSRGVIHRDLKPSNLILDARGCLRILDFGIARLEGQDGLTGSGEVFGTPRYMSPEQAQGDQSAMDARTDVYSLGASLYEMLAFTPPFQGKTASATLHQVLHDDPRPPRRINPRIPRDLETIVLKCLRKRREERYTTAEALAQDLERFARGDPVEARPPSLGEVAVRRLQRHWGKAAAAVAMILLGLGCLFFVWRGAAERHKAILASYEPTIAEALSQLHMSGVLYRLVGDFAWMNTGYNPWLVSAGIDEGDNPLVNEALRLLEEARAGLPDRPDAYYQLARAHRLTGAVDRAAEVLAQACERRFAAAPLLLAALRNPGAEPSGDGWAAASIRARAAEAAGRWDDAAKIHDGLVELYQAGKEPYVGACFEALLGGGIAYLHRGDTQVARIRFGQAHILWPRAVEVEVLEALTHLIEGGAGDLEAEKTFERLFARTGRDDVANLAAMVYTTHFSRHEDGLRWAERMQPGYFRDLWRGSCLAWLGRAGEALEATRGLPALQPRAALSYMLPAYAHMGLGEVARAREMVEKAAELAPSSSVPYSLLSNILRLEGKPRESLEMMRRAVEAEPGSAMTRYYYALTFLGLGRFPEAEEQLRRSLELARDVRRGLLAGGEPRLALGLVLGIQGKLEESRAAYREAVERGNWTDELDERWVQLLVSAHEANGRRGDLVAALESLLAAAAGSIGRAALIRDALEKAYRDCLPDLPTHGAVDFALREAGWTRLGEPGIQWAYWKGKTAPSPGIEWTRPGFDDSAWVRGPGGFGYGDGDDATVLDDMRGAYTTVYLRRELEALPGDCREVELRVVADDGFVAYWNGEELLRARSGEGIPAHDAVATEDAVEPVEVASCRRDVASLPRAERNVIAIVGLNVSPTSSDFSLIPTVRVRSSPAPEEIEKLAGGLNRTASGPAAESRLAYLEGRVLESQGKPAEAVERHRLAAGRDPAAVEPLVALAEGLRALGRPEEAATELARRLAVGCPRRAEPWILWTAILLADLKKQLPDVLAEIPACPSARASDLRLLIEGLGSGRPCRVAISISPSRPAASPSWRWREGNDFARAYRVPVSPGKYRVTLHGTRRPDGADRAGDGCLVLEGTTLEASRWEATAGSPGAQIAVEIEVRDGTLDIGFSSGRRPPTVTGVELERMDSP